MIGPDGKGYAVPSANAAAAATAGAKMAVKMIGPDGRAYAVPQGNIEGVLKAGGRIAETSQVPAAQTSGALSQAERNAAAVVPQIEAAARGGLQRLEQLGDIISYPASLATKQILTGAPQEPSYDISKVPGAKTVAGLVGSGLGFAPLAGLGEVAPAVARVADVALAAQGAAGLPQAIGRGEYTQAALDALQAAGGAAGITRGEAPEIEPEQITAETQALPEAAKAPANVPAQAAGEISPEEEMDEVVKQFYGKGNARVVTPPAPVAEKGTESRAGAVATTSPAVGYVKVSDLKVDPNRFQFRVLPGERGLESAQKWEPNLAGVISVWKNPKDGETYVVNGHHRVALAKRLGADSALVRYIDAPDAQAARSMGALINIAEGGATPLDAAKFFRDSGLSPADVKEQGLSMTGSVAQKAMALKNLSDPLFSRVVTGQMPEGRGVAIGSQLTDPAEQQALVSLLDKSEKRGRPMSDLGVSELARFVKGAGKTTEGQPSLFGTENVTKSLAIPKARLSAAILNELGRQKIFGAVARRAEDLGRAGNVINAEESARIAQEAAQVRELYTRLSSYAGPVSDALNEGAARIAKGEDANAVAKDTYARVSQAVRETLSGREEPNAQPAPADEGARAPVAVPQAGGEATLRPTVPPAVYAQAVEPTLPGMEQAVAEQREAAPRAVAAELSARASEPLGSVEQAAGEMERTSPLFRGTEASPQKEMFGTTLSSGIDPHAVASAVRKGQGWWEKYVAEPAIRKIGLGPAFQRVEDFSPEMAKRMRFLVGAGAYSNFRARNIEKAIVGGLTRDQEGLFTMMADKEARNYLIESHPDEYARAENDPAIKEAIRKYRTVERVLTRATKEMGGATLNEGDYLPRRYPETTSPLFEEAELAQPLPRDTDFPPPYDDRISLQHLSNAPRKASAEYYYEHGLHEFGPSFLRKYVTTMRKLAEHRVAQQAMMDGWEIKPGEALPRYIDLKGKRYYDYDTAHLIRVSEPGRESDRLAAYLGLKTLPKPKDVRTYEAYDPEARHRVFIERTPEGTETFTDRHTRYLLPSDIKGQLDRFQTKDFWNQVYGPTSPITRFVREQTIGYGGGIGHFLNLARRVTHSFPGGPANPVAWVKAFRALTSSDLKQRILSGQDSIVDMLVRNQAFSPQEIESFRQYRGGNYNPANWARVFAKFGHDWLFAPGGVDQRARVYIADLVKSRRPELSDEKVAQLVNDQLGRYRRESWTNVMHGASRFMMFPGWDFSSVAWVIRHPIRTTVPTAILISTANDILSRVGAPSAKRDSRAIHVAGRAFYPSPIRESLATRAVGPLVNAAGQLAGGQPQQAALSAAREPQQAAYGLVSMLAPQYRVPIELAMNKVIGGGEIVPYRDRASAVAQFVDYLKSLASDIVPVAGRTWEEWKGGIGPSLVSGALGNVGLYSYPETVKPQRSALLSGRGF